MRFAFGAIGLVAGAGDAPLTADRIGQRFAMLVCMPETMEAPVAAQSKTQLEEVFKSIIEHAGAKIVYGEPVFAGGKAVLPVAQIRYGFGGSSGGKGSNWEHGGGGGGGLIAKPLGVVEITQSQTRFIPIFSSRTLAIAVGLGFCLGFWAAWKRG